MTIPLPVRDAPLGPNPDASLAGGPAAEAKPILVLGGTGFVGQHLVARLAASGRRARVLTRDPQAAPAALRHERVELTRGNYRDPAALDAALQNVDAVYHLAKGEGRNWQEYLANDVEPTRRIAEAALRRGVRRFIYVGSIDSYASARGSGAATTMPGPRQHANACCST
jgi:nucleoside-diphosphate-sugar epimerase